jgi:glycosyltransferase involved in cell wall biosynthesis
LIELIRYLLGKGVHVDLAVPHREKDSQTITSSFDRDLFRLIRIRVNERPSGLVEEFSRLPLFGRLFSGLLNKNWQQATAAALDQFSQALKEQLRRSHYDIAFAVDATGLYVFEQSGIDASMLANISFEILKADVDDAGMLPLRLKDTEKKMLKEKVQWVLIQDEGRKLALQKSLGITIPNHLFLPNSVSGKSKGSIETNYFHKLFDLDEETRIVLSAGMISEAVCSLDIAKEIGRWSPRVKVKCVFHERLEIPEDRGYHEKVKEAGNGNVLLSLKPVPYDELDKVFASADIGLAIYNKSYGENFSTIGSASGKLFQYIKHGVPVIVSNLPGLADLVEEYEMGIAVGSPSEIPRAIEKILEDRPRFSRNARKAFEENLNMDIHLDRVYQSLFAEAC